MAISIEEAFDSPSFSVNDTVFIVEHTTDPRVSPGFAASIGSLLLDSVSGDHYNKYGPQTTDWNLMSGKAGKMVQYVYGPIGEMTGTAIIPIGTSVPSITSGSEIWSHSITPATNSNMVNVTTQFSFAASANEMPALACIFRDNTCIAAILLEGSANPDVGRPINFSCNDVPGVAGVSVTYSCRVGKLSGAGVWYVNCTQSYSSTVFGGVLSNTGYQLTEITA